MTNQPAQASESRPPDPSTAEGAACPECGSTRLEEDPRRGEVACAACGLVVSERAIDQGPEWRAFNPQQRESRARTGPGRTMMRHDLGLGTQIGHRGKGMSSQAKARLHRLRRYHRQATYRPGADRELVHALNEIQRLTSALNLPDTVSETAARIYRQAQKARFLHGRSIEATAAASVYAAARIHHLPRPLDRVVAHTDLDRRGLGRNYRKLVAELSLPVPPTDPVDLMPAIGSRLSVSAAVQRRAAQFIEQADPDDITGKHPAGLAAAALYRAGVELGEHRTQSQVAEAAGVTEVTLRARVKDL